MRNLLRGAAMSAATLLFLGGMTASAETPEELLASLEAKELAHKTIEVTGKLKADSEQMKIDVDVHMWTKRVDGGNAMMRSEMAGTQSFGPMTMETQVLTVNGPEFMWAEQSMNGQKQVMKRKADKAPSSQSSILEMLKGGGATATVLPDQEYDGENCAVLEVSQQGGMKMTYLFSEATGLMRRLVTENDAMGSTTMTLDVVALDQPIDDAKFEYTPPEGVQVMEIPDMPAVEAPAAEEAPAAAE